MDRQRLAERLTERFDADPSAARVVARAAGDLAERWNWWIGALELSHGGYSRFEVRRGDV